MEAHGRQGVAMTTWFVWRLRPSLPCGVQSSAQIIQWGSLKAWSVWVEEGGESSQVWWWRGHWAICQGCPGDRSGRNHWIAKYMCFFSCCSLHPTFRLASLQLRLLGHWSSWEDQELPNSWCTSSDFPHPNINCTRNYGSCFVRTVTENTVAQVYTQISWLRTFRVYFKSERLWEVLVRTEETAKQDASRRVKSPQCGWQEPGQGGTAVGRCGKHAIRSWKIN